MKAEDLLKMLDIKPSTAKKESVVTPPTDSPEPTWDYGEIHPTAVDVNEWDLGRGEELAKSHGPGLEPEAWADFHAMAFKADPQLRRCMDERRSQFLKTLLETPEYHSLHTSTTYSVTASTIAAKQFAKQFLALKKEDEKTPDDSKGKSTEAKKKKDAASLFRAVSKAVDAAQEEVAVLEEVGRATNMPGGGLIGGDGGADGKMSPEEVARLFQRVKDSKVLTDIFNRSGKFRHFTQGKQRIKVNYGFDEMVGIGLDDVVERLLPEELAGLCEPALALDTVCRLVERETLAYKFRSTEKVGKGPVVITVDESGSMQGEKVANAKAFALSMAYLAKHQNRWCVLIGYSGKCAGTRCVLAPGKWNQSKLLDWLEHFYSGGSWLDVPVDHLPRWWPEINPPKGKTDLIMITDGHAQVSGRIEKDFLEWKTREKVRVISLIINGNADSLRSISDEVFPVLGVDLSEAGVEKCLSI